jgi:ankyrin repeat protein
MVPTDEQFIKQAQDRFVAFLEAGSFIDIPSRGDLFVAIQERCFDFLGQLLARGHDANETDEGGRTLLMYAVAASCGGIGAGLLLKHGADPGIKTNEGNDLWYFVRDEFTFKRLSSILGFGLESHPNSWLQCYGRIHNLTAGQPHAHKASFPTELAKFIISSRLDGLDDSRAMGDVITARLLVLNCFDSAIRKGEHDAIQQLLDLESRPSYHHYEDSSLLLDIASKEGDLRSVEMILKASEEAKSHLGNDALRIASGLGHVDIVKRLLEEGASPNVRGGSGWYQNTALIEASGRGHLGVVKVLLAAGADVNMRAVVPKDDSPYDALSVAIQNGHIESAKLLVRSAADVNWHAPLAYTVDTGSIELVRLLLEAGADANNGYPLAHAAATGNTEMVQILVERGAQINYRVDDYWGDNAIDSPLVEAVRAGHKTMVAYLLEHGADVSDVGPRGREVLNKALRKRKTSIAKLLAAAGLK